jgi:hypothetical protein
MSDWQVGDLAVCVDDGPSREPRNNPTIWVVKGSCYRVSAVVHGLLLNGEPPHAICPFNGPTGWAENRFRKIRPDEHEDCEPEFVELLNRIKRKAPADA